MEDTLITINFPNVVSVALILLALLILGPLVFRAAKKAAS